MPRNADILDKLALHGADSLTDRELLILIMNEDKGTSGLYDAATNLLDTVGGNLVELSKLTLSKLRSIEGIGLRRAVAVTATIEMAARLAREQANTSVVIRSNEDIIRIFRPAVAHLEYEEFWALYLSSANTVLDKTKVSRGGSSSTIVDPKIVIKRAVELLASGIILVHNHPSGIAQPSPDDVALTKKISGAAFLFDITVLDHMIITSGECFSFRSASLM